MPAGRRVADLFHALRAQRPEPGEYHWEPCCFCGEPIRSSATEPCRLLLERGGASRTRPVSAYFCHEACFRKRVVLLVDEAGALRDEDGAILTAYVRAADQVIGERVHCPGCRAMIFARWPEGWDAHASHRCTGVDGDTGAERKARFKQRFAHLFR